jgi:hypothetical protein
VWGFAVKESLDRVESKSRALEGDDHACVADDSRHAILGLKSEVATLRDALKSTSQAASEKEASLVRKVAQLKAEVRPLVPLREYGHNLTGCARLQRNNLGSAPALCLLAWHLRTSDISLVFRSSCLVSRHGMQELGIFEVPTLSRLHTPLRLALPTCNCIALHCHCPRANATLSMCCACAQRLECTTQLKVIQERLSETMAEVSRVQQTIDGLQKEAEAKAAAEARIAELEAELRGVKEQVQDAAA